MGQYFYLVNIDKKQFVHAHEIGNGLKIPEQTGWKYSTETAAKHLCDDSDSRHPLIGSWKGDRIGFIGDEGSIHKVNDAEVSTEISDTHQEIYEAIRGEDETEWENISPSVREMMTAIYGIKYGGSGWLDIIEPVTGEKVRPNMNPDIVMCIGD